MEWQGLVSTVVVLFAFFILPLLLTVLVILRLDTDEPACGIPRRKTVALIPPRR